MKKSRLRLVAPAIDKRTVPERRPNAELRTREHLTEAEVAALMEAAKRNRWGRRDATMILVSYRHGLRASELVDLRWDQIDFTADTLAIRRVKQGSAISASPAGLRQIERFSVVLHRSPQKNVPPKSAHRTRL